MSANFRLLPSLQSSSYCHLAPHYLISYCHLLLAHPIHLISPYLLCQPKRSLPCQSKQNPSLLPSAFYPHLTVISHLVFSTLALISYFPHTLISYSLILLYSLISYSYLFLSFTSPLATVSCSLLFSHSHPQTYFIPYPTQISHLTHYHISSLTTITHLVHSSLLLLSFASISCPHISRIFHTLISAIHPHISYATSHAIIAYLTLISRVSATCTTTAFTCKLPCQLLSLSQSTTVVFAHDKRLSAPCCRTICNYQCNSKPK